MSQDKLAQTYTNGTLNTVHDEPYDLDELETDLGNYMSPEGLRRFFNGEPIGVSNPKGKLIGEIVYRNRIG
jgi:hypothetical protein